MSKWIKKGDQVLVLSGNEKGRTGSVLRREEDRVVVQGINIRKKHVKRKTQMQVPSIVEVEMPIHISNVVLCDGEGNKLFPSVKRTKRSKELVVMKDGKESTVRVLKNK